MNKYLVFIIQAYEEKREDGSLRDACELQLIDTSYEKAVERAKQLVSKSFYRLHMVIEKYEQQ